MSDFLVLFGGLIALISVLVFLIGFIMLFFKSNRKKGLQLLLYSLISFVIGFGTCAANFKLNLH